MKLDSNSENHKKKRWGMIVGIDKNMITVQFKGTLKQNEVGYAVLKGCRLKSEVIRIMGDKADLQVFEETRGLKRGDLVEFTDELLSVELGPGLLGRVFDGLQNPLNELVEKGGFFLPRGTYLTALPDDVRWIFTPRVRPGDSVEAADIIGTVPESIFIHKIMVPFYLSGRYQVIDIAEPGTYRKNEQIALLKDGRGGRIPLSMSFQWPIKIPVSLYRERLDPVEPLITRIRIIDTFFPVAKGGTYCIPGPFGAGKTVLQQITSRNAEVNVVIIAACGERAGEVVETIREFPRVTDPVTGKSLMERTIIICNTSSMPLAARESSVYTAVTLGEYYRQMGLHVLLLADSTSRWAQAMRERSGRLEEIPGEEAFPAYLESIVANLYERAGLVSLKDGTMGSVTICGTVSPAGGNFEEPVTQATLKVVGAFHGLSRERSDARRYPAIDPLESWSNYRGIIDIDTRNRILKLISRANEIDQMMKVVGEEGISLDDYLLYLQGNFIDSVYLQQNAFDRVDSATSSERQIKVFSLLMDILDTPLSVKNKEEARTYFGKLRQIFLDYNSSSEGSVEFHENERRIKDIVVEHQGDTSQVGKTSLRSVLVESDLDSHFRRSTSMKATGNGSLTIQKEEDEKDIR